MASYEVICSFLLLFVCCVFCRLKNKQTETIQAAMPQSKNDGEAAVLNR